MTVTHMRMYKYAGNRSEHFRGMATVVEGYFQEEYIEVPYYVFPEHDAIFIESHSELLQQYKNELSCEDDFGYFYSDMKDFLLQVDSIQFVWTAQDIKISSKDELRERYDSPPVTSFKVTLDGVTVVTDNETPYFKIHSDTTAEYIEICKMISSYLIA